MHRYHEAGFTEIILMLSGGSMSTAADPVKTAAMLAESVLPESTLIGVDTSRLHCIPW